MNINLSKPILITLARSFLTLASYPTWAMEEDNFNRQRK